jgi:hypothetical protein
MAGGPAAGKPDDIDAYMQRLVQLIPAEIVALYLAFHAAASKQGSFVLLWPIVCLALVVFVRILGTRRADGPIWSFQPIAVTVASISFVLWIYAIGDKIWKFEIGEPIWISAGIAIWTIVVPYFYKGVEAPPTSRHSRGDNKLEFNGRQNHQFKMRSATRHKTALRKRGRRG